jgi:hypothetical protein
MRCLALVPALAMAVSVQAADLPYGRLFYTPEQRAALEDARRRNIRAEELAAQAATAPKVPRARKLIVTGVVQRSDGESFAWINGKQVESETKDGLRVRHAAGQTGVVVYDPEKRRSVSVKVGQQIDLTTGRIEESYEAKRGQAQAPAEAEHGGETPAAAATPAGNVSAETANGPTLSGEKGEKNDRADRTDKADRGDKDDEAEDQGDGVGANQGG